MVLSESKSLCVRLFVALWAFLECIFLAGVGYGWSSLVFVFKEEGIYSDLCEQVPSTNGSSKQTTKHSSSMVGTGNDSISIGPIEVSYADANTESPVEHTYTKTDSVGYPTCLEQDSRLSLCFTIAIFTYCVYGCIIGQVNYHYGTRIARLISFAMYASGMLCLSFVTIETPWLMFPGLCMILSGGFLVTVSNCQVSRLFTHGGVMLVGLMSGAYDMSAAVALLIKQLYMAGFSRQFSFLILSGMSVMILISTLCFFPKDFIKSQFEEESVQTMEVEVEAPEQNGTVNNKRRNGEKRGETTVKETLPVSHYLKQPMFITHLAYFSAMNVRLLYFVGNLNSFLNRILNEDISEVSFFTDVCFYTLMSGLILSPLSGYIYEKQQVAFAHGKTKLYRSLLPVVLPLAIPCVSSAMSSVLILLPFTILLYPVFINIVIIRSFVYAVIITYIYEVYPMQCTTLMVGITLLVGGGVGCIQFALFSWGAAYPSAPQHVEIFLLCLSIATLGHPIYLFFRGWREEKVYKKTDHFTMKSAQ